MSNLFWKESIKIGDLSVPRFMAAPLDGITDSPLRTLIRDFSPDVLLFGEMRHVASVVHERTGHALRFNEIEHPLSFQISANTEKYIDEAVEKIIEAGFDMLNLNLGCPARAVVRSGSGSALMEDLPRLEHILNKLRRATEGRLPFTIKIRAGYKKKTAVEVARCAQDCGVEMIIIHPRTAPEKFSSRLDYELTQRVKKAITIPLIFSGNLNSFSRVQKVKELTDVDGFMIGRALWGAPWKIREIVDEIDQKEFSLSVKMMVSYALRHLELNCEHYGLPRGFYMFKKQLAQYIRGVENAAQMRRILVRLENKEELVEHLKRLNGEVCS